MIPIRVDAANADIIPEIQKLVQSRTQTLRNPDQIALALEKVPAALARLAAISFAQGASSIQVQELRIERLSDFEEQGSISVNIAVKAEIVAHGKAAPLIFKIERTSMSTL